MSTARKPTAAGASPARRARLAKVHIGRKELRLDDETYRALLGRLFAGKTSAADLSDAQLDQLLEHFKAEGFKPPKKAPKRAGKRPMAAGPVPDKLRALWLSLYHLGAVRDPREEALAAYVKRTTRVAALQWLRDADGMNAIEGLKKMAERAGVDWSRDGLGLWADYLPADAAEPFAVVAAQWRRLVELGAIQHPNQIWWTFAAAIVGAAAPHFYTPEDWHRVLEAFGGMIRRAQAVK